MSYARMDHAGWIESHNRARNKYYAARPRMKKRPEPLPEKLSDFQAKVMDICGMTFGGIYNAPISYDKIDWNYGWGGVSLTFRNGLASYDRGDLTILVLLCHAARIRLGIDPAGPHLMRLSFWQRKHEGGYSEKHPSISEAVDSFNQYLPEDHRVRYSVPAEAAHV